MTPIFAVAHLVAAKQVARKAARSYFFNRRLASEAIAELKKARAEIVEAS